MKRVAALFPLLSACGGASGPGAGESIECAVDGAPDFSRVCILERTAGPAFVIRSPSGSFRRLARVDDGRGVVAADGAEEAVVTVLGGDLIEVSIGPDRYRLPAKVR